MNNELKKNELNEIEMDSVTGGVRGPDYDFLINEADINLFYCEFTKVQRDLVLAQPDRASRRANNIHATSTGASGGWY